MRLIYPRDSARTVCRYCGAETVSPVNTVDRGRLVCVYTPEICEACADERPGRLDDLRRQIEEEIYDATQNGWR